MIKPKQNIEFIKKEIKKILTKEVDVKVNLGRNKIVKYKGVLSGVYPSLFTITPLEKSYLGKTTYAYAEVLCGSVKLKLSNPEAKI